MIGMSSGLGTKIEPSSGDSAVGMNAHSFGISSYTRPGLVTPGALSTNVHGPSGDSARSGRSAVGGGVTATGVDAAGIEVVTTDDVLADVVVVLAGVDVELDAAVDGATVDPPTPELLGTDASDGTVTPAGAEVTTGNVSSDAPSLEHAATNPTSALAAAVINVGRLVTPLAPSRPAASVLQPTGTQSRQQ